VSDPTGGVVQVEVYPNADTVARRVADLVAAEVAARPDAVLGLPTGSTPLPTYRELTRRVEDDELDLARVRVVILDEYVGLGADDPRSYRATIRREATRPLGIPDGHVVGPSGEASDLEAAAAAFDDTIVALGGVDLGLVGIGRNGRVGFNEPGTPLDRRSHVTTLTDATRADNARLFHGGEVPTAALTQGPATIVAARRLVLVATGAAKAAAVAAAVEGPVTPDCPASIVQTHPDVVVVLDAAAAEQLAAGSLVVPDGPPGAGEHGAARG
jgi:glucosamine-6-phosphate deaminase